MSKFDHFNLISPIYDLVFGRGDAKKIVGLTDLRKDHVLLDVGGGTGRVTVRFKMICNNLLVVDSAMNMLRKAREKRIRAICAQSERLPFRDRKFDRIIMVDTLHHVRDQQQTLNEMWRLLAPGGKLIIEEPDIHHFAVKLIALGEKLLLMRSHFLTHQKILEMCQFSKEATVDFLRENGIAWIIITRQIPRKIME
ncbi:MAG: methyltransferase domain-containing protein [Chloroflexota bacterium]|nr:methyltransferase domain-containing protein [Chloroflexota bacterium]